MAQSLDAVPVAKLESFLVCSICLETLKDPRTLPCFHSYCRSCLEKFVKKQRDRARLGQQIREFNCPTCRNPFTLNPEDKVEDMGQSHFIYNMLEVMAVDQHRVKGVPCTYCQRPSVGRCVSCEAFLCQECLKSHNSFLGFKDHAVLSMDELSKPENQTKVRGKPHCREHKKKTLKFYCETCQELICRRCMDFNHNKAGHSCLAVEDVAEKEKKILVSNSAALEGKLLEGKNALKRVINAKQSLEKVKEQTKRDINQRKDNLLKEVTRQLNDQAQHLLTEVEEIYVGKHNTLVQQEVQVKGYVEKLESCASLSKGLLEKGTDEEILSSTKMMKSNIEKLQNETLTRVEPADGDVISYKCDPIDFSKLSVISEEMGRVTAALGKKSPKFWDQLVYEDVSYVVDDGGMKNRKLEKLEIKEESMPYLSHPTSDAESSECPICLDSMTNPKTLEKCNHSFCTECIENAFKHQKICPLCSQVYGELTGNQPPGKMWSCASFSRLPGFGNCGSIVINYEFKNGIQGPDHPNPGRPYIGTRRHAYLPDNKQGQKVLKLLQKAFKQKLTFTIGRSSTTGREDSVTWNDIHHKTNTHGGPTAYGYPDPYYLTRVQEELAAKGIKE